MALLSSGALWFDPQITQMAQIKSLHDRDLRDPQTYAIIGSAMEVHRTLGPGFLEPVYQSALEVEFGVRAVPFVREVRMPVWYKGMVLNVRYRADYVCFGDVVVELKALPRLTGMEAAQVINYLLASNMYRGILLNFGAISLQFRRFVGPITPGQSVQSVKSVDPVDPAP